MLPNASIILRVAIFACTLFAAGCAEFAERRYARPEEEPLSPAPPLNIAGQPAPVVKTPDDQVKAVPPANPQAGQVSTGEALRGLYEKAKLRYQTMDTYMMRLKRREAVNGKARPEELVLVKFRQEPFSVYFKWIGTEAKGREVVYVKGRPGNEIHTLTAAGDILLLPAGARFSLSADSALVKAKSRYPITDAGIGTSIRKFGLLVEAIEKGDNRQGTVKYMGEVKRPEFTQPVLGVEQIVPPQSDPLLAGGGRRWWFFDSSMGLPVLIITQDETGREAEYYCHDRIQAPVHLDDDDFNPDKLWKKKGQP